MAPCNFFDMNVENEVQESIAEDERLLRGNNPSGELASCMLLNNFLLNEIKAQDDAIRQIMSISGLLIAAYATVIVTIGKMPANLFNNSLRFSSATTTIRITGLEVNFFYLFLLTPLFFWIYALIISVMNLSPSAKKWPYGKLPWRIDGQQDEDSAVAFLIEISKSKYRTYKLSSLLMVIGLMVAMIIPILTMSKT